MTDSKISQPIKIMNGKKSERNIYDKLPDQFTKYENELSNQKNFDNKKYNEEQSTKINQDDLSKNPLKMNIIDILTQMKNTLFEIIEDLETKKFSRQIFTKDDRLFYLGLFLIMIFIIYFIMINLIKINYNDHQNFIKVY